MTPRQHNAAMIDDCVEQPFEQDFSFGQGASAGRAPVGLRGFGQHGVALAADTFHNQSILQPDRAFRSLKPDP